MKKTRFTEEQMVTILREAAQGQIRIVFRVVATPLDILRRPPPRVPSTLRDFAGVDRRARY